MYKLILNLNHSDGAFALLESWVANLTEDPVSKLNFSREGLSRPLNENFEEPEKNSCGCSSSPEQIC